MRAKLFADIVGFIALVAAVGTVQHGIRSGNEWWQDRNRRVACAENLKAAQNAGYYTLVSEKITRDLDFCVSIGHLPAESLEGLALDPTARLR